VWSAGVHGGGCACCKKPPHAYLRRLHGMRAAIEAVSAVLVIIIAWVARGVHVLLHPHGKLIGTPLQHVAVCTAAQRIRCTADEECAIFRSLPM
jgi:hypothetical protein